MIANGWRKIQSTVKRLHENARNGLSLHLSLQGLQTMVCKVTVACPQPCAALKFYAAVVSTNSRTVLRNGFMSGREERRSRFTNRPRLLSIRRWVRS